MLNRRTFLKTGAAVVPVSAALSAIHPSQALSAELAAGAIAGGPVPRLIPLPSRLAPVDAAAEPWQRKIRRVAQSNMTEHDPAVMNIEEWADYWHAAKADIVFISVTGILAFYPSKVKFHKWGKFLHGRDFFGECVTAAKKRGMRAVARMSPDLNWPDALAAHPEWAMRFKDGSVQHNTQEPKLFKTCMFSSYMDDYVPAIMREINSRYDIDCFYTNGWPPLGSLPDCHCAICSKLPPSGTPAYWRVFNDRVLELWRKYDAIAKEKRPENFFFSNLGSNVRCAPDLNRIGAIAQWFQADNQGRSFSTPAIWEASLQGRVCTAVMDGKFATNVTGAYSTGTVTWRNSSKDPAETRIWLSESIASGMAPYMHFVGSEDGFCEDRRWQKTGADYFRWTAQHDSHLKGRRSIANIGVVMGQSTQLLYPGPSTVHNRHAYMHETTQGIYDALLRGRFAFDLVHEDRLEPERLKGYSALLLPNIAMLSDRQCQQIRDYVRSGGSILASFETSLYDENLKPRSDFGFADLLGIHKAGDVIGTNGNAYYARIQQPDAANPHPILEGFTNTNWLAGAENRIPLESVPDPLLTVVPGFVRYPPELAYPPVSHTDKPAVVVRETGSSRIAYFPGDIERTYWLTGNSDLLRLLHNTIRWLTRDESIVHVEGPGFIEMLCWETSPGYAVHLLNYTNPNAVHGWLESIHPIGPQTVSIKLPSDVRVKSVDLLHAGQSVHFSLEDRVLRFTVPRVEEYEVAAITVA